MLSGGMNLQFVCVLAHSVFMHVLHLTSVEPGFHVGDHVASLSESQLVYSVLSPGFVEKCN